MRRKSGKGWLPRASDSYKPPEEINHSLILCFTLARFSPISANAGSVTQKRGATDWGPGDGHCRLWHRSGRLLRHAFGNLRRRLGDILCRRFGRRECASGPRSAGSARPSFSEDCCQAPVATGSAPIRGDSVQRVFQLLEAGLIFAWHAAAADFHRDLRRIAMQMRDQDVANDVVK